MLGLAQLIPLGLEARHDPTPQPIVAILPVLPITYDNNSASDDEC